MQAACHFFPLLFFFLLFYYSVHTYLATVTFFAPLRSFTLHTVLYSYELRARSERILLKEPAPKKQKQKRLASDFIPNQSAIKKIASERSSERMDPDTT